MKYPIVLSIAGSDSSGGAGIQADIKTMSAIGTYATTAITAITVQNTKGVYGIQAIDPNIVAGQIDAVFSDLNPVAVKIGMLFSKEIIATVANRLNHHKPKYIVLDPVMISTSGNMLISDDAIEAMLDRLFPIATITTPNRHEAERISEITIKPDRSNLDKVAKNILGHGCGNVLLKGGHFDDESMTDYLFSGDGSVKEFKGKKVRTENTHGTGCTLSSAIASYLSLGYDIAEAVGSAKKYLENALIAGANVSIGNGHGPVNHFFNPKKLTIL